MQANRIPLIAAAILLALTLAKAPAADLAITEEGDDVVVTIDGELFTRYVTREANKPYFWPVVGPTGGGMTRAYPMKEVPGEKQDHPHHRSLYFGHQFINGFDTWHEKLTLEERAKGNEEKLAGLMKKLGATVHLEVEKTAASGDQAVLVTANDYRDAEGNSMLQDRRTHTFHVAENGSRIIDVEIVFTGTEETVTLDDAKDSGFSVRVAHSICVDAKEGGTIINSEGHRDKDAWGKRAAWCDFNGPVDGKHVGIAILNHPSSFRYPTPWHARTYGLFTANPFGLKTVAKEDEDGTVTLKKGEILTLRHRVIFHAGDEKEAGIAEAFAAYAKETF